MGRRGLTLKELPAGERPRERLVRHGAAALSDAELLAILIRTGDAASGRTALDLARDLLVRVHDTGGGSGEVSEARVPADGLRFLVTATVEELSRVKGIGPAKAIQLKAAVEVGRRVAAGGERREVRNPADVRDLLMEEMRYFEEERFKTILLDTKSRVISVELVSIGSLDSSSANPREVFKAPIRKNAAAVILVHNHPSGDPTPSPPDVEVTKRLAGAGRLLGIEVLDHLIIGDNRYISFRERGIIF